MENYESNLIKEKGIVEERLRKLIYDFLNDMKTLVDGGETKYFDNDVLNAFPINNRKTRKMGMQILLKSFRKDLDVFFKSDRNIVIEEYFRKWNQRSERFPFFAPPPPKIAEKSDSPNVDLAACILDAFIGTFLTFYFGGINFGTGGFASLVLLCGLVVNSGIYIINEYNNLQNIYSKQKFLKSKITLYIKAYNHKIIPVFLTILSTVLGLIPFLTDGDTNEFWFSFAIGTSGGLIFSIIALIFIMPIFMSLEKNSPRHYQKE